MNHSDLILIGGGVVGLSIAYEAARNGRTVTLIDREFSHPQTSWAGAGIITPANGETTREPLEQLRALSNALHAEWAVDLKQLSGIDNEYTRCGCVFVAGTSGELASLLGMEANWREEQIEFEVCDENRVRELFPDRPDFFQQRAARRWVFVPDECRIRNSRHLKAIKAACSKLGVRQISTQLAPVLSMKEHRIESIVVNNETLYTDQVCLAAGCWTEAIAESIGVNISTTPVRGQLVLFHHAPQVLDKIFYEGSLYLVPRSDGHLVAGSTLEEVGFDPTTTQDGVEQLIQFANRWFPELNHSSVVQSWAGLRPATNDGFPYLGKVPTLENTFIATGHFRSGLQLSTGTAKIMCQLMSGQEPEISLAQFKISRG